MKDKFTFTKYSADRFDSRMFPYFYGRIPILFVLRSFITFCNSDGSSAHWERKV